MPAPPNRFTSHRQEYFARAWISHFWICGDSPQAHERYEMKQISMLSVCAFLLMALPAGAADKTLVVTSSNAAANELLVFDTGGTLVQNVATQGAGGVSANAGGNATAQDPPARVN